MSSGNWGLLVIQHLGKRQGIPKASWLYRIAELVISRVQARDPDSIYKTDSNEEHLMFRLAFTCRHTYTSTHTCAQSHGNTHAYTPHIYICRDKNFMSI